MPGTASVRLSLNLQNSRVRGGIWNWSADKSRSGYRDDNYFGSGDSFCVVGTLNVPTQ